MKVVAIIQARMGSTRLPNKMMLYFHGYPICEWVYRRVSKAKYIDDIFFALPDTPQDDILDSFLRSIGAKTVRGSETDLVSRFIKASQECSADYIVRVCADNPLICSSEIDRLIKFYKKQKCDYAYNHIPVNNHYPDGLGAEICSKGILEEIHKKTTSLTKYREHLFNYIWDNPDNYTIKTFEPPDNIAHQELKLDIDTLEDYNNLLSRPYEIPMSAQRIVEIAQS